MSSKVTNRICVNCGKGYRTTNATETCSMKCRDELKAKRRLEQSEVSSCPVCGEVGPLVWTAYELKVCSKQCVRTVSQRRWYKLHHGGKGIYGPRKLPPPTVVCEVCGKTVTGRRYDQKYCSRECKMVASHAKKKEQLKIQRESITHCVLCGVEFETILTPRAIGFESFGQRAKDTKVHLDHIVCRSDGGQNNSENLRPVCWMCNHIRGTMDTKYDDAVAAASKAFWEKVLK